MPNFQGLMAAELERARKQHSRLMTRHEGLAVIEEEFLELRAEVFQREPHREKLLGELVQVAAMCQRFAEDLLGSPRLFAESEVRLSVTVLLEALRAIDNRFGHFRGIGRDLGGPIEALGGLADEVHQLALAACGPGPDAKATEAATP